MDLLGDRKRYLVTGGAGFIGSAVVRHIVRETDDEVVVLDKLTYAGNMDSLSAVTGSNRFRFAHGDVADLPAMRSLIAAVEPDVVMHLAAESHVDRSIEGPAAFIETNIVGTFAVLQAALDYWRGLPERRQRHFRFHHVSTDEVFGSVDDGRFTEASPYRPNSPYSASKAAADHLVRAWHHTYGMPVVVSNCSNNYGPYHFPEKLIPLMVLNCLERKPLPIYGRGENVRDWLYVEDHARALVTIASQGAPGESYNVGGDCERSNLEVVRAICALMDSHVGGRGSHHASLIRFVVDRPGHDLRYAIDASKIRDQLGWQPRETFETGLEKTVRWYLDNRAWWQRIRSGVYRGERLGVVA